VGFSQLFQSIPENSWGGISLRPDRSSRRVPGVRMVPAPLKAARGLHPMAPGVDFPPGLQLSVTGRKGGRKFGPRPDQGNCSQFSRSPQSRHPASHRQKVAQLPRTTPRIRQSTYHISGRLRLPPVAGALTGRGLRSHPGGASPAGYSPQGIYKGKLLPVNVSPVNIRLILINADGNGIRSSLITEGNHFPKPGICGILKDKKSCNLTTQCYYINTIISAEFGVIFRL
jgi:hypothetical protein